MIKYEKYFLLFMICSIIGWIMEVIVTMPKNKKFVNRGFLIGPYCPIYGIGYLFITILLSKFKAHPLALFGLTIIICSITEYFTSYLMEKIFHARWWDYSNKKYNVEGRICLINSIGFGVIGLLAIYYVEPFLNTILNKLSNNTINTLTIILLVIFIVDNIISFNITASLKNKLKKISKDNTSEIKTKMLEKIKNANPFHKRIYEAFPNFRFIIIKKIRDRIKK